MRFILLEILSSPSHLIDSPFIIQNAVVHVQASYVNISYIIFLVYFFYKIKYFLRVKQNVYNMNYIILKFLGMICKFLLEVFWISAIDFNTQITLLVTSAYKLTIT